MGTRHAGFVIGLDPTYYVNPTELVRVFTRCSILKKLREDPRFTQIFANAGSGSEFDLTKLQGIFPVDEEKAEKELIATGTLPVYLAAETQSTRGALVAVTFLLPDAGALSEMVRSLLTFSSIWQETGVSAVAKPDRDYKHVPGETGQGTRQGTATGAPTRAAATELRLQKAACAGKEMQLDPEKGSQQVEIKMQARLDVQQGLIDGLRETLGKVVEETKANMEEIKASKSSMIESLMEIKMVEQTRILMAAIMDMRKGKPEATEEV